MNDNRPKSLVFASGEPTPGNGGSGFKNLVLKSRSGALDSDIIGVVSQYDSGGVYTKAKELGIPFKHFPKPWTAERYQEIALNSEADFFLLSGWMQLVVGLDVATKFNQCSTINIHPGPLPGFGGPGLYGKNVHRAVIQSYKMRTVTHSAVSMHFVTEPGSKEDYDRGPVFFRKHVLIVDADTPESLAFRVNEEEHIYQPRITNLVVKGQITWDGKDFESLQLPPGYSIDHH